LDSKNFISDGRTKIFIDRSQLNWRRWRWCFIWRPFKKNHIWNQINKLSKLTKIETKQI